MSDPVVRCTKCGKELLWDTLSSALDNVPSAPTKCYECEVTELTEEVTHALMDDEDRESVGES